MILSDKAEIPQSILFADKPENAYAGVERADKIVYRPFETLYQKSKGRNWIAETINMDTDAAAFLSMPEDERRLFTINLQWQMAADTLNTAGLMDRIIPLANNMEMRRCLVLQAYEEQNHSDSYNRIVSYMYSDPGSVNDGVMSEPLIMDRVAVYNEIYTEETKVENLLSMVLAMESVSFVTSFLVTFGLNEKNNNQLLNVCDQILKISVDESGHQSLFTNIIRIQRKHLKAQGGYKLLEWEDFSTTLFQKVYDAELAWAARMYAICPLPQLAPEPFKAFLKEKVHTAMRGARLPSIFEDEPAKNTPVANWYRNTANIDLTNAAPQETNVPAYVKDILIKDWPLTPVTS